MIEWLLLVILYPVCSIFGNLYHDFYAHPKDLAIVTGNQFRACAAHAYETLDPLTVKWGDSIFIKTCDLGEFFKSFHPQISNSYILISHVTDDSSPGSYRLFLDDPKLLGWFAMNVDGYLHPKLYPIPIGIANVDLPHGDLAALQRVRKKTRNEPKQHLLFMNFTIQTFSEERWEVFKLFSQASFCFRTGKKRFEAYLSDMASSKFVLAPRGAGLDTYRLWEALYVGSIPIVKSSSLDRLYEDLPVLIVKDWSEVTEEFLEKKYDEFSTKDFSLEKLDFSYWSQMIISLRES